MAEKKVISPIQSKEPAVTIYSQQNANLWSKLVGNIPADSTAAAVAELRTDLNALLAVLRGLTSK